MNATTLPDSELDALWLDYKAHENDANYFGMCCNDCAGWVYPEDHAYEDQAIEHFLETGRLEPLFDFPFFKEEIRPTRSVYLTLKEMCD